MRAIASRQNPVVGLFRELANQPDPHGTRLLLDGAHLVRDAADAGFAFDVVCVASSHLDRIPADRAGFGSTVHLRAESGDTVIYQLVMPEEADATKGMISTSSPIGRAILNKEEGDDITVTTPNGTRSFELVKVITIHDDAQ